MKEVDLDLLADHLGGALEGTPEGARVAELVASDPSWARAAARLSGALDAVAADLATLPEPAMPDDVADRLDQVLRTAGQADTAQRSRGEPTGPVGATARPSSEARRPPRHATRRRRRAARWGAGLAVAAAAAGFTAFGLDAIEFGSSDSDRGEHSASTDGQNDSGQLDASPQRFSASGADYGRAGLPAEPPSGSLNPEPQPPRGGESPEAAGPNINSETDGAPEAGTIPAALRHLMPLPDSCLSAVQDGYDEGVASVDGVDYAHFEGASALVIWVTTETGQRWVTVTGPACGEAGGADRRHQEAVR